MNHKDDQSKHETHVKEIVEQAKEEIKENVETAVESVGEEVAAVEEIVHKNEEQAQEQADSIMKNTEDVKESVEVANDTIEAVKEQIVEEVKAKVDKVAQNSQDLLHKNILTDLSKEIKNIQHDVKKSDVKNILVDEEEVVAPPPESKPKDTTRKAKDEPKPVGPLVEMDKSSPTKKQENNDANKVVDNSKVANKDDKNKQPQEENKAKEEIPDVKLNKKNISENTHDKKLIKIEGLEENKSRSKEAPLPENRGCWVIF